MKRFKRHKDFGFFDQDIRLHKLSKLGDPLEKLSKGVDFDIFRSILEKGLHKESKGKGGRPPYDYVLMFKILILQKYYNLSEDRAEFQINDRLTFMRFLDLTIADDIPDSNTIWNYKETLTDLGLIKQLFDKFLSVLNQLGLVINEGKIVDASFIEVPRQRNTREENKEIKEGITPKSFTENIHKQRQKDVDARWTKKNNESHFGYKNHILICSKSKLISNYTVTDASVHDSQSLKDLLNKKESTENFYADSAYVGPKQEKIIQKTGMQNHVCEKGYKNTPLTENQKESNRIKSKTRARVEHIFGFMEMSMNGMNLNSIGIKRINSEIGLMNLVYNMFRKVQLTE
jgi:IS5 family transposase